MSERTGLISVSIVPVYDLEKSTMYPIKEALRVNRRDIEFLGYKEIEENPIRKVRSMNLVQLDLKNLKRKVVPQDKKIVRKSSNITSSVQKRDYYALKNNQEMQYRTKSADDSGIHEVYNEELARTLIQNPEDAAITQERLFGQVNPSGLMERIETIREKKQFDPNSSLLTYCTSRSPKPIKVKRKRENLPFKRVNSVVPPEPHVKGGSLVASKRKTILESYLETMSKREKRRNAQKQLDSESPTTAAYTFRPDTRRREQLEKKIDERLQRLNSGAEQIIKPPKLLKLSPSTKRNFYCVPIQYQREASKQPRRRAKSMGNMLRGFDQDFGLQQLMKQCDVVARKSHKSQSVLQSEDKKLQSKLQNLQNSLKDKMLNFKSEYIQQVVGDFKSKKQGFVYGKVVQGRYINGDNINPYLKFMQNCQGL